MNGSANAANEFDGLASPGRPHVVIQIACDPPLGTVRQEIKAVIADKLRKACQNWGHEGWAIGENGLRAGDNGELILSATSLPPHFDTEAFKELFQGFGKVAVDLMLQCNLKASVSLDGMRGVSLAQEGTRVCDLTEFKLEPICICDHTADNDVRPPGHEVSQVRNRKEVLVNLLVGASCQAARDVASKFKPPALRPK